MEMVVRPCRAWGHKEVMFPAGSPPVHLLPCEVDSRCNTHCPKPTSVGGPHHIQSLLDHSFALVVQGGGGHVQQEDAGVADQCSGDGDPLLLTPTHLTAPFPHQGVELLKFSTVIDALEH